MDSISWDGPLPRHLAIIMDGNGRWAQARDLPRTDGHRKGATAVRSAVRTCRRLGIEALTLYAFSAQNWERPDEEVHALMELLHAYMRDERDEIADNQIRFRCIGELSQLPKFVRIAIDELMSYTADNKGMTLTLALSYGSREEIVAACRILAAEAAAGRLEPDKMTAADLDRVLWTQGLPADVDLIIRTSGEQRLSNFLLWQSAYAELWFTDTLWPDFDEESLFGALRDFGARNRRFGAVDKAV